MITQAELTALDWIQAHLRSGAMDAVMQVITLFGEYGVFWILLALGLLICPRTRKLGLAMVFALLLDVVLCNGILKPLVAHLYMHFPTDVLCGAIVGIVCGLAGAFLAKRCWKAWEARKSGGEKSLPKKG